MFESLSEKLETGFRKLRGRGKLSESDVKEALREVRVALLEADVHFDVAKSFIENIREKAVGESVLQSLKPGHQVVKVVHEELVELMGREQSKLTIASSPPTIIMLAGLQGSGKTTTAGKLAKQFKKEGTRPLLVPADVQRPGAIHQLKILGKELGVDCYESDSKDPVEICRSAVSMAKTSGFNRVILDTAGRLHIDDALMDELQKVKSATTPHEILFVADAMLGQEAVNVAKGFNDALDITGVILTKMDGDARGGAALSIRHVTGKPIKLIGTGEKLDKLEPFHPERIAGRILNKGDILSLIEKAEEIVSKEDAEKLANKIHKNVFDLEDFLSQLRQMKKLGSMQSVMKMIPGLSNKMKNTQVDDKVLVKTEAIICSMTPKERRHHKVINSSRKKRIARGSGTHVSDVNRVLKQFDQTKKMMKQFSSGGFARKMMMGKGGLPF